VEALLGDLPLALKCILANLDAVKFVFPLIYTLDQRADMAIRHRLGYELHVYTLPPQANLVEDGFVLISSEAGGGPCHDNVERSVLLFGKGDHPVKLVPSKGSGTGPGLIHEYTFC